jgi:hypothetical protein
MRGSCHAVSTDDTSASITSNLLVSVDGQQASQAQKVTFVKGSGAWKIDTLTNA